MIPARRSRRTVLHVLPWMAVLLVFFTGCVTGPYFSDGVELAPDGKGWQATLETRPGTIRYHWQKGDTRVEIEEWPNDPLYFMVSVHNEADREAQMLVQGVSPGPIAHGSYDLFADQHEVTSGRLSGDTWITVPAHCSLSFYIDGLPWRNHPSRGDRIRASVEIIRKGALTICPLSFHVARVFRSHP